MYIEKKTLLYLLKLAKEFKDEGFVYEAVCLQIVRDFFFTTGVANLSYSHTFLHLFFSFFFLNLLFM